MFSLFGVGWSGPGLLYVCFPLITRHRCEFAGLLNLVTARRLGLCLGRSIRRLRAIGFLAVGLFIGLAVCLVMRCSRICDMIWHSLWPGPYLGSWVQPSLSGGI